jgi:hypothetical protein
MKHGELEQSMTQLNYNAHYKEYDLGNKNFTTSGPFCLEKQKYFKDVYSPSVKQSHFDTEFRGFETNPQKPKDVGNSILKIVHKKGESGNVAPVETTPDSTNTGSTLNDIKTKEYASPQEQASDFKKKSKEYVDMIWDFTWKCEFEVMGLPGANYLRVGPVGSATYFASGSVEYNNYLHLNGITWHDEGHPDLRVQQWATVFVNVNNHFIHRNSNYNEMEEFMMQGLMGVYGKRKVKLNGKELPAGEFERMLQILVTTWGQFKQYFKK